MTTPNTAEPLLTRHEVVALLASEYGVRMSHRTLEERTLNYVMIGRRALYRARDVRAFADALLANAPRRTGRMPARIRRGPAAPKGAAA